MVSKRVRMTFEPGLILEPVIYQLGHKFQIVTNIRMADVDEHVGWVVLELEGERDEIERALAWARELGVRVDDPTLGDIVDR
ncbi:MAG: FeS-binding protein [Dehalococcoidia bacterium]|nr:FeS-binding protein [Dehalococcoidia bacterium]